MSSIELKTDSVLEPNFFGLILNILKPKNTKYDIIYNITDEKQMEIDTNTESSKIVNNISELKENEDKIVLNVFHEIPEDLTDGIPDHLITNKDTYDPDPERRMSFAGIIKTDKPFDTKKALDEIRRMEY
jgi:hypothetical protein